MNAEIYGAIRLRRIGAPSSAAPILELGCGDGLQSAYLLGKGYRVIATELTHERLAACTCTAHPAQSCCSTTCAVRCPLPTAACLR